jgi:hypothetical protein
MLHILHAGIFLLDADMKLVLPFHSLVTIQSMWVPTQVCILQVTSLPTNISYCKGNLTVLRRILYLDLAKKIQSKYIDETR